MKPSKQVNAAAIFAIPTFASEIYDFLDASKNHTKFRSV